MKAEHRKELETNTLSATLAKWVESLRGGPTNASLVFWGFLILAVALIVGWRYYSVTTQQARSALWMKLEGATTADDLQGVAQAGPGTPPARYARFERARLLLKQGLEKVLAATEKEREDARNNLAEAAKEFEALAGELNNTPLLAQEALYGLAKAREAQGDVKGALDAYERLTNKYKNSPLGKQAEEQFSRLKENPKAAEEFYAKLNEFAPPPKKTPEQPEK